MTGDWEEGEDEDHWYLVFCDGLGRGWGSGWSSGWSFSLCLKTSRAELLQHIAVTWVLGSGRKKEEG